MAGAASQSVNRGRTAVAAAAIVVLTLAAFWPVLQADFIRYDDQTHVTDNPVVTRGLSLDGAAWAFRSLAPLAFLSHMLDVSLFGLEPGPHHFTSLLLHAATAALLFLLLQRLTGAFWPGLAGAAVFAVHPLRVESVAWVAERKDVLSGLLFMLTLLAYLHHAGRPGIRRFSAVAALFALGLLAKPMLVTLPGVLLLLDWWPLGRLHRPPADAALAAAPGQRCILAEKALLLLPALAAAALTYQRVHGGGADAGYTAYTAAQRLGNALVSCVLYLGKTLWPASLHPFYPHRGAELAPAQLALAFALLAAVTAAAWLLRRRRPWLLAGWLWYLATLVPVIGLIQIGDIGMADRYTYLPSVGLLIAAAGEAGAAARRRFRHPLRPLPAAAALVALIAALAVLTWKQTKHWRDSRSLAHHVLAADPRNVEALVLLGADSLQRGDAAKAGVLLARAVEVRPASRDARFTLGLALIELGRFAEAEGQFSTALETSPDDVLSLANRGRARVGQGLAEPALHDLEAALERAPARPEILMYRALALAQLARLDAAEQSLRRAAALAPEDAEVHYHLGRVSDAMSRPAEAITSYTEALKLRPGYAEAHNDLGVTLVEQGRVAEALPHFRDAVRIAPSYAEARWNLEKALRSLGLMVPQADAPGADGSPSVLATPEPRPLTSR